MKVPYDEDLANHVSPESCGGCGNAAAEALTGENAGGLSSSENTNFRVPTSCTGREGHTTSSVRCELLCDPAESKNLACAYAFCARIGRAGRLPSSKSWNGVIQEAKTPWCIEMGVYRCKRRTRKRPRMNGWAGEGQKPYVLFKMPFGSRTQHSTVEAGEQEDMSPSA